MVEEKQKSKSRFSLKKRLSSSTKKIKSRPSKINGSSEGSAEFGASSGSFHEHSEEMIPHPPPVRHAQHESSEDAEDKQPEKRDRRKSKVKHKVSSVSNSGNSANPKNKTSSESNGSKPPNKKKTAAPKLEIGHTAEKSNPPASAYGLDKQANGTNNVQYTVNEKGESVQFSVNKKGVPELWLQVDHDQCLVSPMTVNSSSFANASSSSLSTTQQSLDSKEYQQKQQSMSSSKQDLFMKTSLLTIGEGGKPKENGVRPKANSLMGERPSDASDDDDSIAAEEQLLNQFDDTYMEASELPKPKAKKKAVGKKKKKKEKDSKENKEKKKRIKAAESGDEDDRKTQPQSNSVMPPTKIPSLEERSSIKLPPAKNGKSKKIKRKPDKVRAKDMSAIEEEPTSPSPQPPPPPVTTPPSSGGGRRISRRIQRINSVPASTFATLDTSSPLCGVTDAKTRASVAVASSKRLPNVARTTTYESPKRMNLKDLRKRFGPQQSEIYLSLSPAALAAGSYKEMPTDLQVYGRPSDQRTKRPGLERKEYRMSQRSLRNLEAESSVSDDDECNLVEYLRSSNRRLDI